MKIDTGHRNRLLTRLRLVLLRSILASLIVLTGACTAPSRPGPTLTPIPLADELVFYNWEDDMPQSVLDIFTREYGVKIKYEIYESQEDAIENMRAGRVYDVVVMESRFIPMLAREGLLAELRQENLPNLRNISANFRELAYDPGNRYTTPYNWGTTGLVFRKDLVDGPITSWNDLWNPRYAGRVGLWLGQRREVISLTLKSLGYSANSEDPAELEEALARLIELKPNVVAIEDFDLVSSVDVLATGQVVLAMGYAYDFITGNEINPSIQYVLPREGSLIWHDTFIIPANSANRHTAELFLNFLMGPEINAKIANENFYATPNEAALSFIKPEILNNPIIFPDNSDLTNAELILPLTPQGQDLYDAIWERFMNSP